jgi:glutamate synthase (NADPH/NADH) small chain
MNAYRFPDFDTPVYVGKKAAIIGGGNTAMDAARTALRLGADTTIVYRRSEAEMPARREELHHAQEEGIHFELLTNPTEILGDDEGWVRGLKCVRMALSDPDESGRRKPIPIENSEFVLDVDMVVIAIGTHANPIIAKATPDLEINRKGNIIANPETGATSIPGVFAGGDIVSGAATVIEAMGAGKLAARAIHDYIMSK